jgi:excisionase family DNA binding protein
LGPENRIEEAQVPRLMTLEEVADYLHVTKKTIYRLLEKRDIPATKIGRQWRFDKTSIDSWLSRNSTGTTINILVIDDDETICSLFKDTLEEAGHKVTVTSDSSKGLELAKNIKYDMVFLDLKMPGINGTELFKQIRVTKPELPVTIITGYPESALMMTALTYGPFGIMKKPFKSSDVLAAVNNYCHLGMLNK